MKNKSLFNIICLLIFSVWFILFFDNHFTELIIASAVFGVSLLLIALLPNKKNYFFTLLPMVLPTALMFYSSHSFAHVMPVIMLLCDLKYLKRISAVQKDEKKEKQRKKVKKSDAEFFKRNMEYYILIIVNIILSSISLKFFIPYIVSQKNVFDFIPSGVEWIYYIFILIVILLLVILSSKRFVKNNSSDLKDRFNLTYSVRYHIVYIMALIYFILSVCAFTANVTDIKKMVAPWLMYILILIFYKDPFVDFIIEKCTQKIHSALESL